MIARIRLQHHGCAKMVMANPDHNSPTWRFPPRNGGIDFVTDPSSAHFSDAPITKLVRELIQNSLDAKDPGFRTPVTVEFTETNINRAEIGGDELQQHLAACFDRSAREGRGRAMATYKGALDICAQKSIRCLKAQDFGTVGLDDTRWHALVVQEGAVSKIGPCPERLLWNRQERGPQRLRPADRVLFDKVRIRAVGES